MTPWTLPQGQISFNIGQGAAGAGGGNGGTKGIVFGGRNGTDDNGSAQCETYDGTSWTTANDMTKKLNSFAGNGDSDNALAICGYNDTDSDGFWDGTISFDGTDWATDASVSGNGRRGNYGGGTSDGGMTWSGSEGSGSTTITSYSNTTEEFDGSSWSSGTNYTTNIREGNSGGIDTDNQIGINGLTSGGLSAVCSRWDGSSWASAGTVPYTNRNNGADSNDDCSEACSLGGYTNEEYAATLDDTTWTQEEDLPTPVNFPEALYAASDEIYCWGGLGASDWEDGGQLLAGSGESWSTADGTLNTAGGYGQGGI